MGKRARLDGFADLVHPALEESQVVDGDEGGAEHFFDVEEVAEVAAGEVFAVEP